MAFFVNSSSSGVVPGDGIGSRGVERIFIDGGEGLVCSFMFYSWVSPNTPLVVFRKIPSWEGMVGLGWTFFLDKFKYKKRNG